MANSQKGMHITLPTPSFPQGPGPHTPNESALDTPDLETPSHNQTSPPPRVSFSHRLSVSKRYRSLISNSNAGTPTSELPPIPKPLPISSSTDSNPLPKIPMIVLCIAVLGEFLSANVSTPFIVKMVDSFGGIDESDIGSYTGMIISAFFVTQFLTSLLWATVANKHGNRAVLFIALLGNAITCALFGTSTTLAQAIAIRLIQGIFNGAVGVARSSVIVVTDPTNESKAYGIMGFSWGLGGVAGAIIGGAFESPAERWPNSFGRIPLFRTYPYLLPPLIASSILLTGAILSLFLAWDGGPRSAIYLSEKPVDVEEGRSHEATEAGINLDDGVESAPGPSLGPFSQFKNVNRKISGYFAKRVRDAHAGESPSSNPASPSALSGRTPSMSPAQARSRAFSRSSRAGTGTAYGHNRNRLGSRTTFSSAVRRGSVASTIRQRREEEHGAAHGPDDLDTTANIEDLNFAQRLVIANEYGPTTLTNLWVAAAISADNEDPFEDEEDAASVMSSEDEGGLSPRPGHLSTSPPVAVPHNRFGSVASRRGSAALGVPRSFGTHRPSISFASRLVPSSENTASERDRHFSTTSQIILPSIYANSGVNTPPALLEAAAAASALQSPAAAAQDPFIDNTGSSSLAPIIEGRPASLTSPQGAVESDVTTAVDNKGSADTMQWSMLPLFIIFQYFILALHTTSHDQVFLMYLTSVYKDGGLGLDPGHFAQLIALMCIAQVIYQFYLYPNIGPPRGRFSHLAMFRIGSALFIPSYLTVTLYRAFVRPSEDGNGLVMALLAASTAVRYAGSTFAYTSIAVLINYLSPPHLVSFANGLAQSLASLARVVGPVLGGLLWSTSTSGNPSGYPFGFYAVSLMCAIAIFLSFFIR